LIDEEAAEMNGVDMLVAALIVAVVICEDSVGELCLRGMQGLFAWVDRHMPDTERRRW
jgi:hypothetical protein